MTIESESFRIAEQLYTNTLVTDEELIQECKVAANQLQINWQSLWNAVRCQFSMLIQGV